MTRDSRRFTQIKRREIGIILMLTDLRLFTYRVQASQRLNKLPTPNATLKVTRNRSNSSALICVYLPSSAVKKRECVGPQMTRDSRRFTQIQRREIGIIPLLTDLRLFTYRVQASQRLNKFFTNGVKRVRL